VQVFTRSLDGFSLKLCDVDVLLCACRADDQTKRGGAKWGGEPECEGHGSKRIASFRSPRHSAVNAEPVYVDKDAEHRLDDSDEEDDHVGASFEEAQAQAPDDESRYECQNDETAQVVAEGDVRPADCACGEVVAQEAHDEQGYPEPGATPVSQCLLASTARLGRRGLRLDLGRLYMRRGRSGAAVGRDGIFGRLLRREVGYVAFAFVFHQVLRVLECSFVRRITDGRFSPHNNRAQQAEAQTPGSLTGPMIGAIPQGFR